MARPLLVTVLVLGLVGVGACGGDDGGGADPAGFCEQLDRLAENDPFAALGATASEAEMEAAFRALVARAEELADAAPADARAASAAYLDAVERLDALLADAGYGTDVDVRAYRAAQTDHVEATTRLERYLNDVCVGS